MILVVGGAFQGKKAYIKQTFLLNDMDIADGSSCPLEEIFRARAVIHFHEYIRRCLTESRDVQELPQKLRRQNPDVIVTANELGSGIVPVEAFDRDYRETAGRVLCELAKEAEEVHRVVCGIGMVIKHG